MDSLLAGFRARLADVPNLPGHSYRVAQLAGFFADRLGWAEPQVELVMQATELHDIGKLDIPSEILTKPSGLTPEERAIILHHPVIGSSRLKDEQDAPALALAARIAEEHHEYFDGSGYPRGLKGQEISPEGRVAALADVYDALRSPRAYKPGFTHEEVRNIILYGDGRTRPDQFAPDLLDVLRREDDRLERYYQQLAA